MQIKYTKPFIYPLLKLRFPKIQWNAGTWGTAITIGDTIHTKYPLAPHILKHEMAHIKQQKASKLYAYLYFIPRYFLDKKFRERQEDEGHSAEGKE